MNSSKSGTVNAMSPCAGLYTIPPGPRHREERPPRQTRRSRYKVLVEVRNPDTGRMIVRRTTEASSLSGWKKLELPIKPARVAVRFEVEGALAYQGIVSQQALFGQ